MGGKKSRIVGWVLSVLLVLFLIGASASGKFTEWEGKEKMFEQLGFTTDLMFKIGVLEVILAILFLIPQTAFIAAILLTGYLGGATVTHLRIGESIAPPIIIGVIVWIAFGLRRPEMFGLLRARSPMAHLDEL